MSGNRYVEPNSGTMPSGTNGSWKRALLAANTRSQCSSMVVPMPTAGPPTAATSGLSSASMASKKRVLGEPLTSGGRLRKSATSLPAQKQSGAPCSSTARTWASACAPASASASPAYMSWVSEFFFSGRASSTNATRLETLLLIKSVVLELLPQRQFRELSGRGMRQLADEHHVVGHPPLGDLALEEAEQVLPR